MGTRRPSLVFVLVLLVLVLLPSGAWADRHNWEVSSAVSRDSGRSNLWGGNVAGARVLWHHHLSLFIDAGKHSGPHDSTSLTEFSGFGGLRYTYPFAFKYDGYRRLQSLVQVQGGALRTKDEEANHVDWTKAFSFGVGLECVLSDHGALRAQVDRIWFWPDGGRERFHRLSLGLVYRFEIERQKTGRAYAAGIVPRTRGTLSGGR